MYLFRKVNESTDIEQFIELMNDLVETTAAKEKIQSIIKKYNQREDCYLLVVEEKETNKLVGSLLAILIEDYTEECKPLCYIENVVVKKEYQGRGIGRAMFDYIDQWAANHHVNYELLVSSNFRKEAHKFYEKTGFQNVKGYKKFF